MTEKMISTSEQYFAALSALDRAAYLACFTPDAVVQDPYGGRPFEGEQGLNKFFDGMERAWQSFTMRPENSYVSGDRVAVRWMAEAEAKSGKSAQFEGINVFTVTDEGLISHLEGYWDFKGMLAQIQ